MSDDLTLFADANQKFTVAEAVEDDTGDVTEEDPSDEVETGEEVAVLQGHAGIILGLAFTADGETLVNADHRPPRPTREWRPGRAKRWAWGEGRDAGRSCRGCWRP